MKILACCPLYPQPPRIYARSVASIFGQDYPEPLEIVFAKHDGAQTDGAGDLLEKHQRARQMALQGGYDALWLVEADTIVPPDALTRLAAVDADVAYGLYCSRHGAHTWLAFSQLKKNSGKSIDRNRRWCQANWGEVVETVGVGMGCTLIHRRVLERVEFRRSGTSADDWYFALDCQEHGFRQAHDLGVVCGHILHDGPPRILWPSLNDPETMYEFEAL